jgi:subtilisin family serine protease
MPTFALASQKVATPHLVLMKDAPVVRYAGGIPGYRATKPVSGRKLDPTATAVRQYVSYLRDQHANALTAIGAQQESLVHSYVYVINGFAAGLTKAQAMALAKWPDVLWVAPDELRQLNTDASPNFLELSEDEGAWVLGYDGTGVVVGVIDSGVWPEHPSFLDDGSFPPPPVTPIDIPRYPACDFGNATWNPDDAPFDCNNKLIGAREYLDLYKRFVGLEREEYNSARDDDGHGTHTASTAAGNGEVEATIFDIPRGIVSGMAPRAHVMVYKACGRDGCYTGDTAAAMDQSVADGVDVIN